MKKRKIIHLLPLAAILGWLYLLPGPGLAGEGQEGGTLLSAGRTTEHKPAAAPVSVTKGGVAEPMGEMPTYKPPLRGAPGGRIGGGTRGPGAEPRILWALAPDHTGLTVQEQPALCWFVGQPTEYPVELTVIETKGSKPIMETRVGQSAQPGVHCTRLADFGVRLKTGVPYEWFVTLVVDPKQRSKDIISSGEIQRVDLPASVQAKLARAGTTRAPFVYAEAGLWYDALSTLADLIAEKPGNPLYRSQRASLLRQVRLKEAADYEAPQ